KARWDPVGLYVPPAWTRHATALLMLPVFPLLIATYFPGRIQATLKHPMLVAVELWAFAHLLANGMLADVLLFGGFLTWAVADRAAFRWRAPKPVPHAAAPRGENAAAARAGGRAAVEDRGDRVRGSRRALCRFGAVAARASVGRAVAPVAMP